MLNIFEKGLPHSKKLHRTKEFQIQDSPWLQHFFIISGKHSEYIIDNAEFNLQLCIHYTFKENIILLTASTAHNSVLSHHFPTVYNPLISRNATMKNLVFNIPGRLQSRVTKLICPPF